MIVALSGAPGDLSLRAQHVGIVNVPVIGGSQGETMPRRHRPAPAAPQRSGALVHPKRWSAVAVLSALLLGLAGCVTVPEPSPSEGRELFAYTTSEELVIADGTGVRSRTPVRTDTRSEIRFTVDAKYIAAREYTDPDSPGVLTAVPVAQPDQPIRIQCDCRGFVTISDSTIAWLTTGGIINRMNLVAAQP
ncbi:hypothetical protein [Nocardia crassostreae]|uniref:hypothetical protein n=1 Tax=Nocardia crassostreae TaxID=53428 RepID=UPI00082E4F43|nr:hypothetical protein [Nocardia crassostreae]